MRTYTRICRCFASRKCDEAAATLKLGHLVAPGPFLTDAAVSHTNEAPAGAWDALSTSSSQVHTFYDSVVSKRCDDIDVMQ